MKQDIVSIGVICLLAGLALGCIDARAQIVNPSNLAPDYCEGSAAVSLDVSTTQALDTDVGCTFVQGQDSGPDLCVFSYQDVNVAASGMLLVSGSRPAVLTAFGDVTVQGVIDASEAGPGTGAGDGASAGVTSSGGGGAGGNEQSGGGGGRNFSAQSGGSGGSPGTVSVTLAPLTGGSKGGAGSGGAGGGRGGGALQLVACGSLAVLAGARVSAQGRGGAGGPGVAPGLGPNGGAGGGSGGSLLLEGKSVSIAGSVTANGGGGGGGGAIGASGVKGQDGGYGTAQALGGVPAIAGGVGGNGGAVNGPPVGGGDALSAQGAGGGGGGAAGRIRVNACTDWSPAGAVISPMQTVGFSCPSDRIFGDDFE